MKEKLYTEALRAYNNAYAPYSKFKVGAAILMKDGSIIIGSNVENASYGLTNCAERSALFQAYSLGYKKEDIVSMLVLGSTNEPISPCGACRQVMSELMPLDTSVVLSNLNKKEVKYSVSELLPYTFKKENLKE